MYRLRTALLKRFELLLAIPTVLLLSVWLLPKDPALAQSKMDNKTIAGDFGDPTPTPQDNGYIYNIHR